MAVGFALSLLLGFALSPLLGGALLFGSFLSRSSLSLLLSGAIASFLLFLLLALGLSLSFPLGGSLSVRVTLSLFVAGFLFPLEVSLLSGALPYTISLFRGSKFGLTLGVALCRSYGVALDSSGGFLSRIGLRLPAVVGFSRIVGGFALGSSLSLFDSSLSQLLFASCR